MPNIYKTHSQLRTETQRTGDRLLQGFLLDFLHDVQLVASCINGLKTKQALRLWMNQVFHRKMNSHQLQLSQQELQTFQQFTKKCAVLPRQGWKLSQIQTSL